MRPLLLGLALTFASFATTDSARAQTLTLEAVQASADTHHPDIREALADQDVAEATLRAARGGFDPALRAYASLRTGGYYELRRASVQIRQAIPVGGRETWVRYRIGRGVREQRFPSYYSDETLEGGEVSVGLRAPLWAGRAMDSRRGARLRGEARLEASEAAVDGARIDVRRAATRAYLRWVASGRARALHAERLTLAQARYDGVVARAEEGLADAVNVLDAERATIDRDAALRSADQDLFAKGWILALFQRDAEGRPIPPDASAVPGELPGAPERPADPSPAIERAIVCHPSLVGMRARVRSAEISRDVAEAARGPRLDAEAELSRDIGDSESGIGRTALEARIRFEMPLGMRAPRGRADAALAELRAIEAELQLAEEQLRAALLTVHEAWRVAAERRELYARLLENAESLSEAESVRFDEGLSTLFVVMQREDAQLRAGQSMLSSQLTEWEAAMTWEALTTCASGAPSDAP